MCCYWPSVIAARDTYQMLFDRGVPMVPKAFQLGVRIEQPQEQVNRVQIRRDGLGRETGGGRLQPGRPRADESIHLLHVRRRTSHSQRL